MSNVVIYSSDPLAMQVSMFLTNGLLFSENMKDLNHGDSLYIVGHSYEFKKGKQFYQKYHSLFNSVKTIDYDIVLYVCGAAGFEYNASKKWRLSPAEYLSNQTAKNVSAAQGTVLVDMQFNQFNFPVGLNIIADSPKVVTPSSDSRSRLIASLKRLDKRVQRKPLYDKTSQVNKDCILSYQYRSHHKNKFFGIKMANKKRSMIHYYEDSPSVRFRKR